MLAAGRPVILDATFMDAGERAKVEALARDAGVQFEGVWLQSDPAVLRGRVAARTGDASDATLAVLEDQLRASGSAPHGWTLVTDQDFENQARVLTQRLSA